MSKSRIAAAAVIPVLLAIGLAFTFLQGRHPTGQAAPTTVAPTSSVSPPPTSRPNPPKATGEDWLAVMSDILTYRHYLYEHPQPELLSQIYDKRCPCFSEERKVLADLHRRGQKFHDEGVKVVKAKLRGRGVGNSSIVAIESIIQTGQQVLVDRNGKVLQRKPASGPTKMTYELVRGRDGRWRVSFTIVGWIGG